MTWSRFVIDLQLAEPLGWSLVLALWHTTLLALLVWGYCRLMRVTSPSRRHGIAVGALLMAFLLTIGTWWGLDHIPAINQDLPPTSVSSPAGQALQTTPDPAPRETLRLGSAPSVLTLMSTWVPWAAVLWGIGVGILAVRLAIGALMALWIRRRAVPLPSGSIVETARRLARSVGLRGSVELFESADIESPAATGWRRPVLIVPHDIDLSLSPPRLEPVIVHELEHLRRRDQWTAVLQAILDALFFYCPGARWLSNQARQTREERCDDAAVGACGSAREYASALAVLASRANGAWLPAAVGFHAPSLSNRIRRLLKGDVMPVMNRAQAFGLTLAVVFTIASGAYVLGASADQMRLQAHLGAHANLPQSPSAGAGPAVPTGLVTGQLGSPVVLSQATGDSDFAFTNVKLRNISDRRVIAVTFLAVVEHGSGRSPAILTSSQPVPGVLEPGQNGELAFALLPIRDILEWKRTRGVRAQAVLGVAKVDYAVGDAWEIHPPVNATNADEVFYLPQGMVISRARLSEPQAAGRTDGTCRDDLGRSYSRGALVSIRGERGATARCTDGMWLEQKR